MFGATPAQGSPPSTYAAYAVVDGEPSAWPRLTGLTLLRAVLVVPGLLVAGVAPKKVATGALYASVGISAGVVALAWWKARQ